MRTYASMQCRLYLIFLASAEFFRRADGLLLNEHPPLDSPIGRKLSNSLSSLESNAKTSCTKHAHFFATADCKIFKTESLCAIARETRTFLASYPCSGNTWMRVLIEQLTGIYTGSMYTDKDLKRIGFEGEGNKDPSQVVMVKTHEPVIAAKYPVASKAVVILRQPLEAVVSWVTFRIAKKELKLPMPHAAEIDYETLRARFDSLRDEYLVKWNHFTRYWLGLSDEQSFNGTKLIIQYEELAANPHDVLQNVVLPFMGISAKAVSDRFDCAVNAEPEGTRRKHTYKFTFTSADKEAVSRIIDKTVLERAGYAQTISLAWH